MFGYIKPYVPEMRVAEYERFRAVYCGLCRAMGSCTGTLSRLTLNYDYVFLAAVRMALTEEPLVCRPRRCAVHPMTRRSVADENGALLYTARVASYMMKEKLADDRADESGFHRFRAGIAAPFVGGMTRRAERFSPKKGTDSSLSLPSLEEIHRLTERLYQLEKEGCDSINETSAAFGEVLAYVFSHGLERNARAVSCEIGRTVGQFVYVCDAMDDLVEDMEKGRYNPIYRLWGDQAVERQDGRTVIAQPVAEAMKTAAKLQLRAMEPAIDLLPLDHPMTAVIKNIVYLGMPGEVDAILQKKARV